MDFSPEATLDLGPRTHRRNLRWKQRKFLLWPALAWRVLVPNAEKRALNPLQRAVLRLAMAGQTRYDDIAQLLGLAKELIAFIGGELLAMGAIDAQLQITHRGHKLLDGSLVELSDMSITWAFRDGRTGKLMPRFAPALTLCNVELNEAGHAIVTAGSKGRPYTQRAFVLGPEAVSEATPTPRELSDALHRFRIHSRRAARMGLERTGMLPAGPIERFSIVSDHPEEVHLLTFVYVPERFEDDRPWYVADPFGLGASQTLAETLERVLAQADGGLKRYLESITGAHLEAHRENVIAFQILLKEAAEKAVEAALPRIGSMDDAPLREAMIQAHVAHARLKEIGDDKSPRAMDPVFMRIRQALESGIALLLIRHPPGDVYKLLEEGEKDLVRATLKQCAVNTGFPADKVPRAVLKAKASVIQYICTGEPKGQLRAIIATLLLQGAHSPGHPIRAIAAADPDWLMTLDGLLDQSNDAVHGGSSRRDASDDAPSDVLGAAGQILKTLLEALASAQARE